MGFIFNNIGIVGMGMMGSSLAYALKKVVKPPIITGYDIENSIGSKLIEQNIINNFTTLSEKHNFSTFMCAEHDLVIVCLPAKKTIEFYQTVPASRCLITDIASTKEQISMVAFERKDLITVGSHPMCGSENSGTIAMKKDLFNNKLCMVSSYGNSNAVTTISDVWKSIGMEVFHVMPDQHDIVVSEVSHVPHMLSSILAHYIFKGHFTPEAMRDSPLPVTGGGLKDMLRIAGSNPEMWHDILMTNKNNILRGLDSFNESIETFREIIKSEDEQEIKNFIKKARNFRNIVREEV